MRCLGLDQIDASIPIQVHCLQVTAGAARDIRPRAQHCDRNVRECPVAVILQDLNAASVVKSRIREDEVLPPVAVDVNRFDA